MAWSAVTRMFSLAALTILPSVMEEQAIIIRGLQPAAASHHRERTARVLEWTVRAVSTGPKRCH